MCRVVVSAVVLPTTPGLKSFIASKSISGFQENPGRLRLLGVFFVAGRSDFLGLRIVDAKIVPGVMSLGICTELERR